MRRFSAVGRRLAIALSFLVAAGHAWQVEAYQTFGVSVGGRVVELKWPHLPVRYYVTDRSAPGVSAAGFRDAAGRAFATWASVPTASVSAQFAGFTSANPGDDDGQNTLGFMSRPDLQRVLGATNFLIDDTTGELLESDIFFNTAFPWSVAAGGSAGSFDLESIILHETGHMFGLGHSALGETELRSGGGRRVIAADAVLFPIAFSPGNITDRTPFADDIAGLSELYPRTGFTSESGSMSGRVTKNGQGVFGAHVAAFNPRTGNLVGGFTGNGEGRFTIASLAPGPYIVRVEPVDDADLDSFFDDASIPKVDLNFRIAYYEGFVVVPAGGGSLTFEVKVVAK
ncbi:MAG TPA: carboxypeptidase regulatory-like domain-containing protein [Vicinamibacterales bacterium]|jgi:hypothetical protein